MIGKGVLAVTETEQQLMVMTATCCSALPGPSAASKRYARGCAPAARRGEQRPKTAHLKLHRCLLVKCECSAGPG